MVSFLKSSVNPMRDRPAFDVPHWQDWASFALGLWLAVSPWALDYSHLEAATASAAFAGLVIALGSHFEVSFDERAVEWFNMAAGLWLVLAPFLLGFGAELVPTVNSIAVGTLVAGLASSALSLEKLLLRSGRFLR